MALSPVEEDTLVGVAAFEVVGQVFLVPQEGFHNDEEAAVQMNNRRFVEEVVVWDGPRHSDQ